MDLTDDELKTLASASGLRLESWMTNPPKPAQWHGTPEALRKFAAAVWDEARVGVGVSCGTIPEAR